MAFKKFLRKEFGSLRDFKRQFMSEPGHFRHDWIRLMNLEKRRYLIKKRRVSKMKNKQEELEKKCCLAITLSKDDVLYVTDYSTKKCDVKRIILKEDIYGSDILRDFFGDYDENISTQELVKKFETLEVNDIENALSSIKDSALMFMTQNERQEYLKSLKDEKHPKADDVTLLKSPFLIPREIVEEYLK